MAKEKKAAVVASVKSGMFNGFEAWTEKNNTKIFYVLCGLCLFLSFISFNARISEAHDDALYLEGGWRYVNEFPVYFYTQNAPLYPMFLAVLIKLMGLRLIVFKLFSMLFNLLGFILFYKALRGKIPAIIFFPVALFHAANYLIIYFASMTFTEAFYFFLQGCFFYQAVKITELPAIVADDIRQSWKKWLLLGLCMFLVSTAKSSAIFVIPSLVLFFAIELNWKAAGYSVLSYLVIKLPYELLVRSIWDAPNQFKGQSRILLQKDPYDKSLGDEDVAGFIQRFIDNCNLSLSKRFYQILGWMDEGSLDTNGFITLLTAGLILLGLWQAFKRKHRIILMLALFSGAQLVLSFVILQARWDQPRITLVCMPVLLILVFFGLYAIAEKRDFMRTIMVVLIVLMCGSVLLSSLKRGVKNIPIVQRNLKGDKYFGYTADWQNFLKCSEWCADSLPQNSLVASRKAPMSFVYGKGKKFFPVYSVVKKDTATNQSNADSALAYFRKNGVTHVMLGSLRINPADPSAGFINTMHNIIAPIAQKYPLKLNLLHTEGQFEEAYVYELKY